MYNSQFWLKYTFRIFHVLTFTTIGSSVIYEYLFDQPQLEIIFSWTLSAILMISGFINIYLLEPHQKMQSRARFWVGLTHIKLISTLLIIAPIFTVPAAIRFYFVLCWLLLSPFLRFYREHWSEPPPTVIFEEL